MLARRVITAKGLAFFESKGEVIAKVFDGDLDQFKEVFVNQVKKFVVKDGKLEIDENSNYCQVASVVAPKILECSFDIVKIEGYDRKFPHFQANPCDKVYGKERNIDLDVLKRVCKTAKYVRLDYINVTHRGKHVVLEEIVEVLPQILDFYIHLADNVENKSFVGFNTLKHLLGLDNLGYLRSFQIINGMSDKLLVKEILAFVKKFKGAEIFFGFVPGCSENFKDFLEVYAKKDMEDFEDHGCVMHFPGNHCEEDRHYFL